MPPATVDPGGPAMSQLMLGRTRSSQPQTHDQVPSREELAKLNQDVMASAKMAREFLERQGYALPDAQGNRVSLSYTLLLLPTIPHPVYCQRECEWLPLYWNKRL